MQVTLIIGIGSEFRRDDGVGLEIARQLRLQNLPNTRVLEASGEGAELMELWKDAERVIIIDAVSSGMPAGTLHRLDASVQPMPARFFSYSSHAFSLAEAVEMARALKQLPPSLIIYGIEGQDFGHGVGLSLEVEKAAREVVRQVGEDVRLPVSMVSLEEGTPS